ncbi:MAG: hypothetical protein LBD96_03230 [Treponema sp.]|jgi:hypothetical protein|nr:hypothetical protein [Treponema sp.]
MNPKDWFRDQKWGGFTHYLYREQNTPARLSNQGVGRTGWNECVDALDVERLATHLAEAVATTTRALPIRCGNSTKRSPPFMPGRWKRASP